MIEYALAYAARGYKVFPLHTPSLGDLCSCNKPDCQSIGKHPRTINGLSDATTEVEKIQHWWSMWPEANIGLATGADSGFVVIDVDPRHGGTESLKALQARHGTFPEKAFAHTGGGGWHLFFAHPGFRVRNVQNRPERLGAGVDVRGDGGYVVAPPSLHASGEQYRWGGEFEVLPEMPDWLKTLLSEPQHTAPAFTNEAGEVAKGDRHKYLVSLAGSMRRRGMSEEAMYAALSVENERKCNPPKTDLEIRKIAHSVSQYNPEDPAYVFPETVTMEGERPDGIYFVSDFEDRIDQLYEQGMLGGLSTGIPSLDWHYTVKPGQWTVVTGAPSHGKSALLDCILYNLAQLHGWRFAVTSVENQPLERHAAQLMQLWAGQPFGKGDVPRMDRETKAAAKRWLSEHFVFVLPDEGGCTVGGILERVKWIQENEGNLQGIVIDPWNELEHRRPAGMNETEYVSQSLTRMRRFARSNEMHLWLVAHPTKLQKDVKTGTYPVPTLYDISGSAHFRNKADNGISVWRDVTNERSATAVHIQKVRFRECGRMGMVELYFDVVTGRFQEVPPCYVDYTERGDGRTEEELLDSM